MGDGPRQVVRGRVCDVEPEDAPTGQDEPERVLVGRLAGGRRPIPTDLQPRHSENPTGLCDDLSDTGDGRGCVRWLDRLHPIGRMRGHHAVFGHRDREYELLGQAQLLRPRERGQLLQAELGEVDHATDSRTIRNRSASSSGTRPPRRC